LPGHPRSDPWFCEFDSAEEASVGGVAIADLETGERVLMKDLLRTQEAEIAR